VSTASDAREVARLVPMPQLLYSFGFDVNERTRRAPCLLHSGSNPTAFSWTHEGLWHCHSCGMGGDKIALVRAVRNCSFSDGVDFLAGFAGVQYRANRKSHEEIKQLRSEQAALRKDASIALAVARSSWRETRETVLQLETIRRNAGGRLKEIFEGSPERWLGETEWCWTALGEVARQMPRAAAAYSIASFGSYQDRFRFALDANAARQLIGEALDIGYVKGKNGQIFKVIL
jgi:hypothetical protein